MLLFPEVARRDCADCKQYSYRDGPGNWGEPIVDRAGNKIRRPLNVLPPCNRCPKIPKGSPPRPESAVVLSERNLAAYWHYKQCKAVGSFPDDPIVQRNAAIIRELEDQARMENESLITRIIAQSIFHGAAT